MDAAPCGPSGRAEAPPRLASGRRGSAVLSPGAGAGAPPVHGPAHGVLAGVASRRLRDRLVRSAEETAVVIGPRPLRRMPGGELGAQPLPRLRQRQGKIDGQRRNLWGDRDGRERPDDPAGVESLGEGRAVYSWMRRSSSSRIRIASWLTANIPASAAMTSSVSAW